MGTFDTDTYTGRRPGEDGHEAATNQGGWEGGREGSQEGGRRQILPWLPSAGAWPRHTLISDSLLAEL